MIQLLVKIPLLVMTGMGILAIIIIMFFRAQMTGPPPKPVEFFTQTPGDQVYVLARARGNLTPDQMLDIGKEIERRIQDVEGIASVYTTAGGSNSGFNFDGLAAIPADTVVQLLSLIHI